MKKALTLFLKSALNTLLYTVISYYITIITHVCCMSIRIFCLKKCLRKCLIRMLESIENIDILKTGKNIDKEGLIRLDNFLFCFFIKCCTCYYKLSKKKHYLKCFHCFFIYIYIVFFYCFF